MKIELTSQGCEWNQGSQDFDGTSSAVVERDMKQQWQFLLNARVYGDDGNLLDEYTLAADTRGKLTLEKKDRAPFLRK